MYARNLCIKEYFEINFFDIPHFQRSYVWKKGEIDEIYDDFYIFWLNNNVKENSNIFLGSIFIFKESNWNTIIDGQQRTIFLYILLTCFKKNIDNWKKSGNNIESILENCSEDQKIMFKDILDWFEKRFMFLEIKYHNNKLIWNSEKESFIIENKKFIQMNNHFKYLMKKIQNDNKMKEIRNIISISNFILKKINITLNSIDNNDSINDIFESINSKGKKLTTLDLIRNDFYKKNKNLLKELDYIIEEKKIIQSNIEIILNVFICTKRKKFFSNNLVYRELKKIFNNNEDKIENLLEIISFYDKYFSEKINSKNYFQKWIFFIADKFNLKQFKKIFLLYIWENRSLKYDDEFLKKILLSIIYFINLKNNRANEIERLMISNKNQFINNILINNEFELSKLNFWFKDNYNNFINLNEFKEDIKMIYLFYFLNIKEIDNAEHWWNIIHKNIEHVKSKSICKEKNINWCENIGNIIFYDSKKNKIASDLDYIEKLNRFYNDPNGIMSINYNGKNGDPVYIMYNYITELKGKIWDFNTIKSRNFDILNNIKEKFLENFSNSNLRISKFNYLDR